MQIKNFTLLDCPSDLDADYWELNDAVYCISGREIEYQDYQDPYSGEKHSRKIVADMTGGRTYLLAEKAIKEQKLYNCGLDSRVYTVKPKDFLCWARKEGIKIHKSYTQFIDKSFWSNLKEWYFSEVVFLFAPDSLDRIIIFPNDVINPFESTDNEVFELAKALEELIFKNSPDIEEILSFKLPIRNWLEFLNQNKIKLKPLTEGISFYTLEEKIALLDKLLHNKQSSNEQIAPVEVKKEGYTTIYLDLMHQAIVQLKITKSNQPKAEEIQDWFKGKLVKAGEKHVKNKAKLMATFVRLPEMQKGGNRKTVKKQPANPLPANPF